MALEPGQELDILVAQLVMNLKEKTICPACDGNWRLCSCSTRAMPVYPNYSENISNAWEVMEKMRGCKNVKLVYDDTTMEWICFTNDKSASSDFAPHAICLLALKVFEESSSENP